MEKEIFKSRVQKRMLSITEYMGKVPKIPNQVINIEKDDIPYKANYDRLAVIIRELGLEFKQENWVKATDYLFCFSRTPNM